MEKILWVTFSLIFFGLNAEARPHRASMGSALPPEVRFCRAAVDANTNNDDNLHFFSVNDQPFCSYPLDPQKVDISGYGIIGQKAFQSLTERAQNYLNTLAVRAYNSSMDCATDSSKCFVCDPNQGCAVQSAPIIDGNGNAVENFQYYQFSDGSLIGKQTLDAGAGAPENLVLTRALTKRDLQY